MRINLKKILRTFPDDYEFSEKDFSQVENKKKTRNQKKNKKKKTRAKSQTQQTSTSDINLLVHVKGMLKFYLHALSHELNTRQKNHLIINVNTEQRCREGWDTMRQDS